MAGEIYEVQGFLKFGRGGPSCPSELRGRTVSIECLEGNVFELPAEAACLSGRVRSLLWLDSIKCQDSAVRRSTPKELHSMLDHGVSNTLRFEIKRNTMTKICEYLKHHRDHTVSEIITPLPSDDLRDCGASRWDCSFVNVDHETLFDIGFAANTLAIPSLDFLVNAKIACSTSNKSADKLRKEYKMVNDLPAQEEAELRRAYTSLQKSQGEEADMDLSQLAAASVAQSGLESARQQMMTLKDADEGTKEATKDQSSKAVNTKSWRRGMWSAAVKKDWQVLADAPPEIQGERSLVESAIYASQGRALKHASFELRADEELVLLATSFLGKAFGDAAPELRGNRSFVLKAVARHGAALSHAEQFRGDKSFLLDAAKAGCGSALQGASDALRSEKDFLLEMVIHDAITYKYASEELRSDKEFAMEAARRNGAVLKFMSSNFQADLDIVQVAIARDPRAAAHAHPSRRHELGITERDAAIGQTQLAEEYKAQVEAGRKSKTHEDVQPDMGPRQLASEPIAYTTLKLAKVVGFSAGSTMMGNFGQGNYVAANAYVDLFPYRLRPETLLRKRIDTSVIMWGAVGGGIGMRNKAFGDQDVLLQEEDALLSIEDATKAVRFMCARMHAVPLVMPIKFDKATRDAILAPSAGTIKLEIPTEDAKAAETLDYGEASRLRDQEALRSTAIIDRRPVPGNVESSPLGGWPQLAEGFSPRKLQAPLHAGMRISLKGVRGKNGLTGSLLMSLGEGKWKAQLDNEMGSAIVHESNVEIIRYSEGPVDQRTKDERTALRRAKIQEKRSQLLEKKAAKGNVVEQILATTGPSQRKRMYWIAGTWNGWEPEEMLWNENDNHFSFPVTVGETIEAFQVLLDQQGNSCLHAGDVPQRCPQGGVLVQGPDPKWRCEGFNFKMAKASGCYSVRLLLDAKGFAKKVQWVPL